MRVRLEQRAKTRSSPDWYGVPYYQLEVRTIKKTLRAWGIVVDDHPDDGLYTVLQRLKMDRRIRGTIEDLPLRCLQGLLVLMSARLPVAYRQVFHLDGWLLGLSIVAMGGVGYGMAWPCGGIIRDLFSIAIKEYGAGWWETTCAVASGLILALAAIAAIGWLIP
jgi:hypothetical protein